MNASAADTVPAIAAHRCHQLARVLGASWQGALPGHAPAPPETVEAAHLLLDEMHAKPDLLAEVVGSLAGLTINLVDWLCAETEGLTPEDIFLMGIVRIGNGERP